MLMLMLMWCYDMMDDGGRCMFLVRSVSVLHSLASAGSLVWFGLVWLVWCENLSFRWKEGRN
jgi:hypothetical protein